VTLAEAAGLGGCAGCGRRAWAAAVGAEQVRLNARDAGGPATLIPGVDYDPVPAADNDCEED
jgi:hypothetical protein